MQDRDKTWTANPTPPTTSRTETTNVARCVKCGRPQNKHNVRHPFVSMLGGTTAPPAKETITKAKTMGIQVEPELYAKLERVRDKYKTGSLKNAMLLAAREGLKYLNV